MPPSAQMTLLIPYQNSCTSLSPLRSLFQHIFYPTFDLDNIAPTVLKNSSAAHLHMERRNGTDIHKPLVLEPRSDIRGDTSSLPAAGRPQCAKNLGRYEKSLEQEKLDEWGQPEPANAGNRAKSRRQHKKLRTADEDEDDDDFSSASESESEESDVEDIPNDEVALLLPSKLMPSVGKGSKCKRNKAKPGRLSTQPSIASIASTSLASVASASVASLADDASVASAPIGGAATTKTQNPIYYFYETVAQNSLQQPGEDGDKHYKCYHGNRTVVTVTKAGRHNLTKLIRNLKSASAPIYSGGDRLSIGQDHVRPSEAP
ncbi:hypothetical protein CPB84DRAFT_1748687 [Gymnopilus junonius]|uniref:Uncharacterized protein n=1 Tax=Gymnopilus junonius TaxID=109634 RepID=A0A9P5NHN3_GYMJU|nr:hypothetical protein CPB84DRAFT_1748687 [Gymnopilus junonius]